MVSDESMYRLFRCTGGNAGVEGLQPDSKKQAEPNN
jgi:hypothetical protein